MSSIDCWPIPPLQVESMAKQTMQAPVEIQVGGRSVVNKDITQYVEIRQPHERFFRLLEILGNWQEQGKVLVFVNSQEQCDKLFRDLLQVCNTDWETHLLCLSLCFMSQCDWLLWWFVLVLELRCHDLSYKQTLCLQNFNSCAFASYYKLSTLGFNRSP